jgi:hypothetical protein
MIDLYLFNTIINTIWYIFTVLFVLYRFTSFFNYIYNFIKFCSKLFSGVTYLINKVNTYINYPNNYTYSELESQINTPKPTFFQKCKTYIKSFFYKTQSTNHNQNLYYTSIQERTSTIKQRERELFDKQMNDLYNSEIDPFLQPTSLQSGSNLSQSTHFDFNSNIQLHNLDKSKLDNKYFNNSLQELNYTLPKNRDTLQLNSRLRDTISSQLFHSIDLNSDINHHEIYNPEMSTELFNSKILNNQMSTDKIPNNDIPNHHIPSDNIPTDDIPIDDIPIDDIPIDDIPIDDIPNDDIPIDDIPIDDIPNDENQDVEMSTPGFDEMSNKNLSNSSILFHSSFINHTIKNKNFPDKRSSPYEETILRNPYI